MLESSCWSSTRPTLLPHGILLGSTEPCGFPPSPAKGSRACAPLFRAGWFRIRRRLVKRFLFTPATSWNSTESSARFNRIARRVARCHLDRLIINCPYAANPQDRFAWKTTHANASPNVGSICPNWSYRVGTVERKGWQPVSHNRMGAQVRMIRAGMLIVLALGLAAPVSARPLERWIHPTDELANVSRRLHGQVLDFTCNHGADRRIFSPALGEKRDLYVYLPPQYSPQKQYPLVIYLHGFGQDEESFLKFVELFDRPIACGKLPPVVIAAPDGSIRGRPSLLNAGSFYVNSKAGRFEDFVVQDVWTFMHEQFSIRPERAAHALVGGSMGGFGAFNLGIKCRDRVGIVAGVLPPLNLRFLDCHGRYFVPFDPDCIGWRQELRPYGAIGRFAGGLIVVRERRMTDTIFGRSPDAIRNVDREARKSVVVG